MLRPRATTSRADDFADGLAADAIERWLVAHVASDPVRFDLLACDLLTPVASYSPTERLRLVQRVLERSPALARMAQRLPLAEQFRLSLQLLGQPVRPDADIPLPLLRVASARASARCPSRQRGRPR